MPHLIDRRIHVIYDCSLGILGIVLNALVLYMTFFLRSKTMKMYRNMLLFNASIDFLYSINCALVMISLTIHKGIIWFITESPVLPNSSFGGYLGLTSQLFLMFLSITILPIQFIYRYFIMKGRPLTYFNLLQIFCVSLSVSAFQAFLSPFTVGEQSPEWEAEFRRVFNYTQPQLPIYLIGDIRHFGAMELHFVNILVIVGLTYLVIVFAIYKTTRVLGESAEHVTHSTKQVQDRMALTMYLQAVYPLIFMCFPSIGFVGSVVSGVELPYLGEWAMGSMHTPPVFNALSVICCLPAYRSQLVKLLCCSDLRNSKTSTTVSATVSSTARQSANDSK